MERLDYAFLGLWILLGLVKVTLFLWLMTQLWGKVLQRPVTGLMTAVHSGGLLAAGTAGGCLPWRRMADQEYDDGMGAGAGRVFPAAGGIFSRAA